MHGTPEMYAAGCTCSRCVIGQAARDQAPKPRRTRGCSPSRILSQTPRNGDLQVECWCQESIVHVQPSVIRACLTASCGLPDCRPKVSV